MIIGNHKALEKDISERGGLHLWVEKVKYSEDAKKRLDWFQTRRDP